MANPKLIVTAFADLGAKNDIPESGATEPQQATMSAGWPAVTETPINEGGIPPDRKDFNGLGYLTTSHLAFLNRGQWYGFDPVFAGQIGGYPQYAKLQLDSGDIVQSTIPNNTNNPNTSMAGWVFYLSSSRIRDDSGLNQQEINNERILVVSSKLELESLTANDGQVCLMTGYYEDSYRGGDHFKYDLSKSSINNNVTIINGWVKQFQSTKLTVSACGAKGNGNDDATPWKLAVSTAVSMGIELILDMNIMTSQAADLTATLRIDGDGGAMQGNRSITVMGDNSALNVLEGFSSESSKFSNIWFRGLISGQGTAFRSINNGYLSTSTFENISFERTLRYGIDANIVICRFYDCDFGSFPSTTSTPFKAIRALGIANSQEPNANTFYSTLFRKGNDDCMIEWTGYGSQWQFFACTFEQNNCSRSVIKCESQGSIMFWGGYIEANQTPYFIENNGNTFIAITPLIQFNSIHLNMPALTAISKNNSVDFPKYSFTGCYGVMECAIWESNTGSLNSVDLLGQSLNNQVAIRGSGSKGSIHFTTGDNGLNFPIIRTLGNSIKGSWTATTGVSVRLFTVNSSSGPAVGCGGLIQINCMNGLNISNNNIMSTYTYAVTHSGGNATMNLVGKSGYTDGSNPSYPSFDFTIESNGYVSATPIGSTAGEGGYFSFEIFAPNNLSVA